MDTTPTNIPVKSETKAPAPAGQVPWNSLATLRDEMDRLFDDFFTGWPMASFRRRRVEPTHGAASRECSRRPSRPPTWSRARRSYKITAELPGMSEKDLEIVLAGDMLTLKGEKKEEHEEKGENRYVSERRYGSFQRSFALPRGRRRGEDRGGVQERGPDRHPAEAARGAGQAAQDRGQGGLKARVRWGRQQPRWRPSGKSGSPSAVRQGTNAPQ